MKKSEILVSITGQTRKSWQNKLKEIEKLGINRVALFVECYGPKERVKIYEALLKSSIKTIPFVHARHDMDLDEFKFLMKKYKTKFFNLHVECFDKLDKLRGIHKKLLYEHSFSNTINSKVKMEEIGGFCIDLSHFKSAEERWTNEFEFVFSRRKTKRYFIANHLNGYDPVKRTDIHTPKSNKDFDYLETLPDFVFGKYIALEMFNSIKQQLKFKEYIMKKLKGKVKIKN